MDITSLSEYDEVGLLTALVRGEAEGEPLLGKIAVAWVVKNRVADYRWPDSWNDTMLQPKQFTCFSAKYFRPAIIKPAYAKIWWKECKFAAFGVYHNWVADITCGANHYHNKTITPYWADDTKKTVTIGNHIFYRL